MKKFIAIASIALMVSTASVSCKKGPTDAELQSQATTVVTSVPGASVEVKDGQAHLSGTFADAQSRDAVIAQLKGVKGIKDVHDMTTIAPAAPAVSTAPVNTSSAQNSAVLQKVKDALKDYPSVQASEVNGELVITGKVSQTQARSIRQSVDGLNIKNVKYNYTVN